MNVTRNVQEIVVPMNELDLGAPLKECPTAFFLYVESLHIPVEHCLDERTEYAIFPQANEKVVVVRHQAVSDERERVIFAIVL
jgi:hypothetical protein